MKLVGVGVDEALEDVGLEALALVAGSQGGVVGGGVGEFGGDGHEIAGKVAVEGSGGLDGDLLAEGAAALGEGRHGVEEEGFAPGEDDMGHSEAVDLVEDALDGHNGAFGVPRGVGGVAPDATQVTPARADEGGGDARPDAFSLDGGEDLGDAEVAQGFIMEDRHSLEWPSGRSRSGEPD